MTQAVLDAVLIKLAENADELLYVKTDINVEGYNIDGTYFMIFEKDSLAVIIKKIKDIYGME
jgi:chemotaxis protein CheY-P-specific phosphatase CheC